MSVSYLQVSKNRYLIRQAIKSDIAIQQISQPTNHIWIYDRSVSMYGILHKVCEDLKKKAQLIPVNDTITLGYFSSEGTFNWIIKGFKITSDRDYSLLEKAIDKNNSTIAMTCFSEILADTQQVIEDLSMFSSRFSLMFLSDGYPVVSNLAKEITAINTAIKNIAGKLTSAMMVGYGDYFDQERLGDMAERSGGRLVKAKDIHTFSLSMESFITDAGFAAPKQLVEPVVLSPYGVYYTLAGSGVNLYTLDDDDTLKVSPGENAALYILSDTIPEGAENLNVKEPTEELIQATYAASLVLSQRAKTDVAVQVLATLGDVAIIDKVNSAFTNAEYATAEGLIQKALTNSSARFLSGRNTNYLPAEDAFCILDLMDILMSDKNAFFYPTHPKFKYKKIGVGQKVAEGYREFIADVGVKCPVNALTWNDKKLNLSVLANIKGTIELKDGWKELGFAQLYPTHVYRNYTVVKDGFLNVNLMPLSFSQETFFKLKEHGLLDASEEWVNENVVYLVDLSKIPVINKAIANGRTSATNLCKSVYEELQYEAKIKALKAIREEIDPDGDKGSDTSLTPEQETFLLSNGIGKDGYNPPIIKEEPRDKYFAKEFSIKLKGLSSLPKVSDVREKYQQELEGKLKKPMKKAELLVAEGLKLFYGSNIDKLPEAAQLAWLDATLEQLKKELRTVRQDIQKTKFAVLLAKKWFDEFPSRDESKIVVDEVEYTLGVREVAVEI